MRRLIPLLFVGILAVAGAVTTGVSLAQAQGVNAAVTMPVSCTDHDAVMPTGFTISCADANSAVTDLTWTDWGQATAYATGVVKWNDCTPTCVAGSWKSAPITLWVWDVRDGHYSELSSNDPSQLSATDLRTYGG